jgi:PleD family two-component response regulator
VNPMASDVLATPKRAPYKVLVADPSGDARDTLVNVLSSLGPQRVSHACTAQEFERLFVNDGLYDLVVCRALIGPRSGLKVLAKARSGGSRASFILYTSLDGAWLRIFVSDVENTVLSSRVVSLEGLANLAGGLLEMGRA